MRRLHTLTLCFAIDILWCWACTGVLGFFFLSCTIWVMNNFSLMLLLLAVSSVRAAGIADEGSVQPQRVLVIQPPAQKKCA